MLSNVERVMMYNSLLLSFNYNFLGIYKQIELTLHFKFFLVSHSSQGRAFWVGKVGSAYPEKYTSAGFSF